MKLSMSNIIPPLMLLLSACTSTNENKSSAIVEINSSPELQLDARLKNHEPIEHWWNGFNDETLNQLIQAGLQHNQDLRIALANLNSSRAMLKLQKLDRLSTVRSSASAQEQRISEEEFGGLFPQREIDNYRVGFDAFWELDLFGRVRHTIETQKAQLAADEAALRDLQVSVVAEIARHYMQLRGWQMQYQVAEQNLNNQSQTMALIQTKINAGVSHDLDLHRAEAQLSTTRSVLEPLKANIHVSINRLSVLTGEQPNQLHRVLKAYHDLPELPSLIAVGQPKLVLERRPDVRRAEQQLRRALAQVEVQRSDLYPRLTLGGSLGFSAMDFDRLGRSTSSTHAFGPSLSWAAFDLGRVKARINASDEKANGALANYQKVMLRALEEIDSSIQQFARQDRSRAEVLNAAHASAKASDLARDRYEAGLDDYLTVLDAERTQLTSQSQLVDSQVAVVLSLIDLYKALGGGWETLPQKREIATR